ncbi:MAG: HlyD family efflux transporter periplasmic adaptor subunit [Actinomycetota bacterium]|nr:HlyD family efflux transporter periplasmic adaptor subunit [Actinomycetota bacterium]
MVVRAPGDGTVVVDNGVVGAFVTAGTRLAVVYDLPETYVTARIDERDLGALRIGHQVDVRLDSDTSRTLVGHLREIQPATAASFAAKPPDNTASSFDRVTQVIPVKIAIADWQGLPLVPGLNVTVKIHKN